MIHCLRWLTALAARFAESEPESETEGVEGFWGSQTRIPNNTGRRSRIFCPTPTPDVQLDHFLHHIPTSGTPVKMVQFILKNLLKQIFLSVHHDSQ